MEGGPLVEIVYNYSLLPLCQGGVFRSGINRVQFFFFFFFFAGKYAWVSKGNRKFTWHKIIPCAT